MKLPSVLRVDESPGVKFPDIVQKTPGELSPLKLNTKPFLKPINSKENDLESQSSNKSKFSIAFSQMD